MNNFYLMWICAPDWPVLFDGRFHFSSQIVDEGLEHDRVLKVNRRESAFFLPNCEMRHEPAVSAKHLAVENWVWGTVTIWVQDKSGIQMVQTFPVVEWSGFWMVVRKLDKNVCFMVFQFRMVCLIMWSVHIKTGQKSVQKVKCSNFRCSVLRWLLNAFWSTYTYFLLYFWMYMHIVVCCCTLNKQKITSGTK